tara:strand:- start:112 stop:780 length:669 start_codon:yes stop_codon:yes gene_type:complete
MHQTKSKKIFIYLFLLIIFGSINNINFNKIKLYQVKNIKITGLNDLDQKIKQDLENLKLKSIFLINNDKIIEIIDSNSLVEKYKIFKNYPSTLDIKIEKTNFLARINQNGKIFIIGSNGKLSKNNFSTKELPYIFGNPKISDFLNFKKIVDNSKIPYDEIKNIYFFKSYRWDLELKNNILIKLSKDNVKESLDNTFELLNNDEFKNIKFVDARIKNQIILND